MSDLETQSESRQSDHQLYVGNIPYEVDESQLIQAVNQKIGENYKEVRLALDKRTGRSRGYAFIHFNDKPSAETALTSLAGIEIDGRPLRIDNGEPRRSGPRPSTPFTPRNTDAGCAIFIGNLPFEVTSEELAQSIETVLGEGKVQKVRISSDRNTGVSRGFGHVELHDPSEVDAAVQQLSGLEFMGRKARVDVAAQRDPNAPREFRDRNEQRGASIFIGNLAWNVSEELLKEMLDDMLGPGLYSNVRMAFDKETGRPRGYAHVDFKDKATVERAINELNDLEVLGRQIRVDSALRNEGTSRPPRRDSRSNNSKMQQGDSFETW